MKMRRLFGALGVVWLMMTGALAQLQVVLTPPDFPPVGITRIAYTESGVEAWDVDVWVQDPGRNFADLSLFLGYDVATSAGWSATPEQNLVSLASLDLSSDQGYDFGLNTDDGSPLPPGLLWVSARGTVGGYDPIDGGVTRPYGEWIRLEAVNYYSFGWNDMRRIGRARIYRTGLAAGDSATIRLYDAGQGDEWTTSAIETLPDGNGGFGYQTVRPLFGSNGDVSTLDLVAQDAGQSYLESPGVYGGEGGQVYFQISNLPDGVTTVNVYSADPRLQFNDPSFALNVDPINHSGNVTCYFSTQPVSVDTPIKIYVEAGGTVAQAEATLYPAIVESIGVETIEGGLETVGAIYLRGQATEAGIDVELSTSSAELGIPTTVRIQPFANVTTFPITTQTVGTETAVGYSATWSSRTVTCQSSLLPSNWSPTIYGIGDGAYHGLGNGLPFGTGDLSPISGLRSVKVMDDGYAQSAAIDLTGQLWTVGTWSPNMTGHGGALITTPTPVPGVTDGTALAMGVFHLVVLRANGKVYTTGSDWAGQLGTPGGDTAVLTEVPGLTGVKQVAAGWANSMALRQDGRVWTWGSAENGGLGRTGANDVAGPVLGLTNVTDIAQGGHALALRSDGKVYAWGGNGNGQLGLGDTNPRSTPTLVPGLPVIVDVDASGEGSYFLAANGDLYACGAYFRRGDGNSSDALSPRLVPLPGPVVKVVAGHFHTLAQLADGRVFTWGANWSGQCTGLFGTNEILNATEQPLLNGMNVLSAGWSMSHVQGTVVTRRLRGTIDVGADWMGNPASIQIDLYNGSGSLAWSGTTLSGSYQVAIPASLPNGTYSMFVRGRTWMWSSRSINLSATGATGLDFTLINGDIDGDNSVTVFDYDKLSSYFDKSSADSDWNTPDGDGIRPSAADLDGDGAVTVFDYDILSRNFDANGDPHP